MPPFQGTVTTFGCGLPPKPRPTVPSTVLPSGESAVALEAGLGVVRAERLFGPRDQADGDRVALVLAAVLGQQRLPFSEIWIGPSPTDERADLGVGHLADPFALLRSSRRAGSRARTCASSHPSGGRRRSARSAPRAGRSTSCPWLSATLPVPSTLTRKIVALRRVVQRLRDAVGQFVAFRGEAEAVEEAGRDLRPLHRFDVDHDQREGTVDRAGLGGDHRRVGRPGDAHSLPAAG